MCVRLWKTQKWSFHKKHWVDQKVHSGFSSDVTEKREWVSWPTQQFLICGTLGWNINAETSLCSALCLNKHMRHLVRIRKPVQFSPSVMSDSLRPHELQHARPVYHQLPEFTQTHIHPVSDAIQPSHPLLSPSLPAPNPFQHQSFPMNQLFAWGGQSTGVSALASFLPKKSQGGSPSERTGWISLRSKGLSRVFSNTTVQKHQCFSTQLSLQSNSHIHTWLQEKP